MSHLKPEIVKAVMVTAELTGTNLSEPAAVALVEHLSEYDTAAVLAALHRCRLELKGALTLAAVLDRLDDGHLGPEQAWALVAGLRESQTVVWTHEIAAAWLTIRHLTDRVAARLAFLEDYRQRLAKARSCHQAPRWQVSEGEDATQRRTPILEAMEARRLTPAQVQAALPPYEWPAHLARPALPPAPAEDHRADLKALLAEIAADTRRATLDRARE
jgi:hypothetical protein